MLSKISLLDCFVIFLLKKIFIFLYRISFSIILDILFGRSGRIFFLFVNKLYVCEVFTEDKANKSSNPAKPAPINETSLFFEFLMISIFLRN